MVALMSKEETHLEHSILVLISSMRLQEEYWVLIFGSTVLRRHKIMLILI